MCIREETQRAVASEISGYIKLRDGHSWQYATDSIQGFASVVGTIVKITLTDHGTPAQQLKFVVGYDDQQSATRMFKQLNTIHEHAGMNVYDNVAMWDHTINIPSLSAQIN